ncbi:hypothetical protein JOD64_002628 [Micromonospora luteifusca]|uniref:Uncharacterized protein n=1 Tax=Micromonospora luteifusca TaxID=709860 RepID=A0ABS2LT97_9ACTN|nr:hypothetical protein [Micromonospora luteifusca]MBM7491406.1 hypothetical protein [Micromonospora luteifusca]
MTVDKELSRALAELTRTLTPRPDPYGRARARYRRMRQRRLGGLALALVVSVGGAAFAVAGPGRTTQPPPADSTEPFAHVLAWSDKLLQSPPRGAVAQDSTYIGQLSELLLATQRRGELPRLTVPVSTVKVLFADDVDGQRIALAAFVRDQPDPATGWPSAAVWLVAEEGASAQKLASTAAARGTSDALEPYESLAVDDPSSPGKAVHVAIAPAGCAFLSSPLPTDAFRWTPEATGSYLIRTPQTQRPEWWRVDCGTVTRKMTPGPGSLGVEPITDAQLATAMSRVRGSATEQRARELVDQYAQSEGYRLSGLPKVVWGGHVAGIPSGTIDGSPSAGKPSTESATVTVLAAPTVGGGWVGEVTIDPDQPRSDGAVSTSTYFTVATDPTDPAGLLAVSLDGDAAGGEGPQALLVVAPAAATTVRVRSAGRVAATAVSGSGALLTVPRPTAGLVVEALDASGGTLATGQVAKAGGLQTLKVDAWNQE